MKFIFFIFAILISVPSISLAEECGDSLNQERLVNCLKNMMTEQDVQLNKSYKLLRARLSISSKKSLKSSQLAWLKFRESDCDLEASSLEGPGSYQPLYLSCMIELTELRTKRFDYLLKQF